LNVDGGLAELGGIANGANNWTIPNIPLRNGDNRIVVRAQDANGATGFDIVTLRRSLDRYSLAEGATGTFFDLDLAIANPNAVAAPVDITFLTPSASPSSNSVCYRPRRGRRSRVMRSRTSKERKYRPSCGKPAI
jgi:hypothetical protein